MKINKHFKTALAACMCAVLMTTAVCADEYPQYHAMSAAETGISISSEVYTVDNTRFNIKDIPSGTTADEFVSSLDVANGGKTEIIRENTSLASSDELASGDVLRAYTVDFAGFADYVISFEEELTYGTGPVVKLGQKAMTQDAPGYFESGGNAWGDSGVVDEDGNPARTLRVSTESDDIWASWRPVIETTGEYEVFYWQGYHASQWSDVANYNIHHADENGDIVTTNVKKINIAGASGWVSLGTYKFTEGTEGYVSLHRVGSNYKACKAAGMKFVYNQGVALTCNSSEYGDGGVYELPSGTLDITLTFDASLDTSSIDKAVKLESSAGTATVNADYDAESKELCLTTEQPLEPGTRYILTISKDITSASNVSLVRGYVYVFDILAEGTATLNRAVIPYLEGSVSEDYTGADTLLGAVYIEADDNPQTYCVVMCCFDSDGKLVDSDVKNVELSANEDEDVQLEVGAENGTTAEIYVWHGEDFYALCNAYTVNINQ